MTDYKILLKQAADIIESEPWCIAALSNISSLIMTSLKDLNWVGFYLVRNGALTVGPFQGKPACVHIPLGKGVCGTSILSDQVLNVPDVHRFPGHIACDSASSSEIVIPLHADGKPVAVLDIDSPLPDRFSLEDKEGLTALADVIEDIVRW